jgi:hypothetical protein
MKKGIFCFLFGLVIYISSSMAFAAQYDFFGRFIPEGTPAIDGVITPGEWDKMGHITLYKFYGEDAKIEIYLMWDQTNLYLGADIQDFELWVDNFNPETYWESTWDDDAFKWEIDPDYSRDQTLQPNDRVFAVNADGSASRFVEGDGSGSTIGTTIFDTIQTVVKYSGTLNDYTFKTLSSESQKDGGFVVEVAISWRNIFGSENATAPADGYSLGMNLANIEDDTGGSLNPAYYREWKRAYDELTWFMGEDSIPENWAEFVISSKSDTTPPSAISNLKVSSTGPYAAKISFTATGDNGSGGYAKSYDVRYSTLLITDDNWSSATVYNNNFRPQKAGKEESFKLIGLVPQTTYYIGVKAIDERGNSSPVVTASFITTGASSSEDKGYLTVDPGGRYLAWENGEPFVVIGDNQGMPWPKIRTFYDGLVWDETLGRYRNFYMEEGISVGRNYLKYLSDHGVNTLRIMAESYDIADPVYLFTDVSGGPTNITFNNDTLNFLETFLDECRNYNINVVIVPFDTFYYKTGWTRVPFSTAMGGPMSTPSDFFDSAYRDYLKAVFAKLVDTIGDRKNLLAWDIVNEFDNDDPQAGWNRASFDQREETVNALADYLKSIDSNHMVYLSSVRWDPRITTHLPDTGGPALGADAALVLNNRHFDVNSTHTYFHDIRDPNHNDPDNRTTPDFTYQVADLDNTIAPAVRIKQGVQFYYANGLTPKPYFNTEAGALTYFTSEYDQYFTAEDDNQYFHNMIWAHLASGEVGTGLRWPGVYLDDHALSDQMRKYQLALKNIISDNLDFLGFQPVQIGQYLEVSNTIHPVVNTGITDGKQGIIFLVNDERRQANGSISGARLTVPRLAAHGIFTFEFWDSYDETATTPTSSVSATADGQGEATINLPAFSKTQVIKLYRTDSTGPVTGNLVTDDLWIRAVINTEEKGAIEAVWQKGGEDTTSRGDRVIWGHFYASPSDVTWGSQNNPDLFVKIWFDVSGRVDVNYFHVSVPDIVVYSNYPYDGTPDEQGTTTMSRRYIRQYYENGQSYSDENYEDGNPPSGYSPAGNPSGFSTINDLRIGSMINTVEKGPIDAVWRLGGQDTTSRGDQVVWGHFYASPSDVTWGSSNNPDLFVKIWFDVSGRVDVNFFHVSVPDIEVYSALPDDGTYDQKGTTIMDNRYIRHEF